MNEVRLENESWRQHYSSGAEIRLNSMNRTAPKSKQAIYVFDIVDRESYTLRLRSPDGVLAKHVMYYPDLFSFAGKDGIKRNFENLFQAHERRITEATIALENRALTNQPLTEELFYIYVLKWLNVFRNPNNIIKTLNTLHDTLNFHPLDRYYLEIYKEIALIRDEELEERSGAFCVTPQQFRDWMQCLLMVLHPPPGHKPGYLFKEILFSLLSSRDVGVAFYLNIVDPDFDGRFVLSDRGFIQMTDSDDTGLAVGFNLSDRMALSLGYIPIESFVPPNIEPEVVEQWLLEKKVQVFRSIDNREWLEGFNQQSIYQAKENVFCSQQSVSGATLI